MPDAVLISGMVIANPLSWVCMASRGAPVRQHLGRCAHEQNPLIPSLQNGEPVGSPLTAVPCRGTNHTRKPVSRLWCPSRRAASRFKAGQLQLTS